MTDGFKNTFPEQLILALSYWALLCDAIPIVPSGTGKLDGKKWGNDWIHKYA
jgi:hypothetical protein